MANKTEHKLFMLTVGFNFKPNGFRTEQHDIVFAVGASIEDAYMHRMIRKKLPIPEHASIHIDTYREIDHVDGYDIAIHPKNTVRSPVRDKKLWFINLGGYKLDNMDEQHKRLLFIEERLSRAIARAMEDPFIKDMDTPHAAARPHMDDERLVGVPAVDADDKVDVAGELENYSIILIPSSSGIDSMSKPPVITGYYKIEV